jgi:hypothetical protein
MTNVDEIGDDEKRTPAEAASEAKGHIADAIGHVDNIGKAMAWALRALDNVVGDQTDELRDLIRDVSTDELTDALREAEAKAEEIEGDGAP